jgi:hypothetical protein
MIPTASHFINPAKWELRLSDRPQIEVFQRHVLISGHKSTAGSSPG